MGEWYHWSRTDIVPNIHVIYDIEEASFRLTVYGGGPPFHSFVLRAEACTIFANGGYDVSVYYYPVSTPTLFSRRCLRHIPIIRPKVVHIIGESIIYCEHTSTDDAHTDSDLLQPVHTAGIGAIV